MKAYCALSHIVIQRSEATKNLNASRIVLSRRVCHNVKTLTFCRVILNEVTLEFIIPLLKGAGGCSIGFDVHDEYVNRLPFLMEHPPSECVIMQNRYHYAVSF